jgi:pSer/pThr/pTyr-binding forkhead associated (FHA) protein
MISVRCPHCQIGLKVDESKIPDTIQTFNCPKCKQPIAVSYVINGQSDDSETVILSAPEGKNAKAGKLHVLPNEFTPEQFIRLMEGVNIIGRKSPSKESVTAIETKDKLMSRSHIGIEVRPDAKGKYNHYLYDNKSTNRTLYNRNYIEPGETVILKDNDEIQIGQTRLIFEQDSPC